MVGRRGPLGVCDWSDSYNDIRRVNRRKPNLTAY